MLNLRRTHLNPDIFGSADGYDRVGCKLVPHNEWPSAPLDVPIIGLKELPESMCVLLALP